MGRLSWSKKGAPSYNERQEGSFYLVDIENVHAPCVTFAFELLPPRAHTAPSFIYSFPEPVTFLSPHMANTIALATWIATLSARSSSIASSAACTTASHIAASRASSACSALSSARARSRSAASARPVSRPSSATSAATRVSRTTRSFLSLASSVRSSAPATMGRVRRRGLRGDVGDNGDFGAGRVVEARRSRTGMDRGTARAETSSISVVSLCGGVRAWNEVEEASEISSSPMWPIRVLWSFRKVESAGVSGSREWEGVWVWVWVWVWVERAGVRNRLSAREEAGVRGLEDNGSLSRDGGSSTWSGLVGDVGDRGHGAAAGLNSGPAGENLEAVGGGDLFTSDVGETTLLELLVRTARCARALPWVGLSVSTGLCAVLSASNFGGTD